MEDCSEVLSGEPRREEGDTGPGRTMAQCAPVKFFCLGERGEREPAGRAEIY